MRASILALLIAGCASKPPAPAPAPTPAAFAFGADDECAPVEMAPGWHASRAELDQVMLAVAADATAVCSELLDDGTTPGFADATAVFAAAVPACGAQVAGDRRLVLCRGELGSCRMRATSREVAGRRWITVRFPDIADYTAHVFEVGAAQPPCAWSPYMTPACRDEDAAAAPATGCPALDAAWPSHPAELRDYLCSGGEP